MEAELQPCRSRPDKNSNTDGMLGVGIQTGSGTPWPTWLPQPPAAQITTDPSHSSQHRLSKETQKQQLRALLMQREWQLPASSSPQVF